MKAYLENLKAYQGQKVFVCYRPSPKADHEALYQILMSVDEKGILMDTVPGRHIFLSYGGNYPHLTHVVSTAGKLLFGEW